MIHAPALADPGHGRGYGPGDLRRGHVGHRQKPAGRRHLEYHPVDAGGGVLGGGAMLEADTELFTGGKGRLHILYHPAVGQGRSGRWGPALEKGTKKASGPSCFFVRIRYNDTASGLRPDRAPRKLNTASGFCGKCATRSPEGIGHASLFC